MFVLVQLSAQEGILEYSQNLSISEGLAHSGVTSILEDSRGYMWIGTYDGLNRYDGYEFTVYKNTRDKELFHSNRIRTIQEDSRGNLWIGTDEGLSIYYYAREQFDRVYSHQNLVKGAKGPIIRSVLENKEKGRILCATEDAGVLVFGSDYKIIQQYLPPDELSEQDVLFYNGVLLDSSNCLFATSAGLLLFNMDEGDFRRVLSENIPGCNSITISGENSFLLTLTNGIVFLEYENIQGSYSFEFVGRELSNYQFNSASIDDLGNLWFGSTREGILRIDNLDLIKNGRPFSKASYMVESGILRSSCIASSTSYGCWAGTFNKGIYRFALEANPIKGYNSSMAYEFGLKSNHVTNVCPLDDHRFFVTAMHGGMALFNTRSDKFEALPFRLPPGSERNIRNVFLDSKGNAWILLGTGSAMIKVQAGRRSYDRINLNDILPSGRVSIRTMAEDRDGNLWLGCIGDVYKLQLNDAGDIVASESLKQHPEIHADYLALVRTVYPDPLHDLIWVGTDTDGLIRIDNSGDRALAETDVQRYTRDTNKEYSVSSNFVSSVIRLPNEELWIGTEGGGICKIIDSEKDAKFISFSEEHGLSNDVVKSLVYDDEYNLWVSTNIGLNKFSTKDYSFRSFGRDDGLPFEGFTYNAAILKNGVFVFSGLDGFIYFDPEEVSDEEASPRLMLGELRIHNKTILPGDTVKGRVVLDRNLADMEEIALKHDEDVFSIALKSLHFSNPDNHFLRYRLLPVNQEWIEVPSGQRFVYYNGLRPGEYVFNYMASNSLGEWTEPETLQISISPPFRKTTLAFVIYVLLLLIVVYVVIFFILRIHNLNHKLQIEQLEIDKVKEVNAAKLRFFSNISHEIKTPLSLISGPVDSMVKRLNGYPEMRENLLIVKRQSRKIALLVNQVHDFQRAEANRLKMNSTRFSFDAFIKDLVSDYEYLAQQDSKILETRGEDSEVLVLADRDKLGKIFNNLLNNAFKYTSPGDSISISYERDERDLLIRVADTGKGIDSEDLPHVFERFYQARNQQKEYTGGSGIGLAFTKRLVEMHYGYINAESTLDQGTIISIRLPIVKKRYTEDQQAVEQEILSAELECPADEELFQDLDQAEIEVSGEFSDALIYMAEDNPDMRNFVSGLLSRFFKVKAYSNGKECLNAMEEEWPDLVVSDVLMPELNGFELCKRIKSDIKTSHIPIIMLTACTATDDQIKGIMDGADAYIYKPFDPQHLVASVESLLRNRKQLRERFQKGVPLALEKGKHNSNDSAFLDKLYTLIEKNLDNYDLDMDSLARELYLNRSHFYQKVKALTDQTPFELLKMLRLEKAARLLIQENISVNEAYMRTGFKSRTHFSKLFKEKYKLTPGKYAAEMMKQDVPEAEAH